MYCIQHQSTEYLCPVKTRSNKLVSFQSLTVTQGYIMFWPTTLTVHCTVDGEVKIHTRYSNIFSLQFSCIKKSAKCRKENFFLEFKYPGKYKWFDY